MELAADLAVGFVALLHLLFMVLEMFMWRTSEGRRISGLSEEAAATTATIAANQGLYNGFLAAGLVWSLFPSGFAFELRVFFLGCIIIAGAYGAVTANRTILLLQAVPGLIALMLVLFAQPSVID